MSSPTRRIFYSYDCIFFYLRGVISLHKGCIWETGLALRIFPLIFPLFIIIYPFMRNVFFTQGGDCLLLRFVSYNLVSYINANYLHTTNLE